MTSEHHPIAHQTIQQLADSAAGILFAVAQAGEAPIHYATLAAALRVDQRGLGPVLDVLAERCTEADVPHLGAFVVLVETYEPSSGWTGRDGETPAMARHRAHRWASDFVHSRPGQPADTLFDLGLDRRPRTS